MNSRATPINVLHILEDYSEIAGGIPRVVREITKYLASDHLQMKVLHAKGDSLMPNVTPSPPSRIGYAWSWNPNLKKDISTLVAPLSNPTILHIHGTWSSPQLLGAKISSRLNMPFILSSHGMLEPWLWNQQGLSVKLKKSLYWNLFAYPCFSEAKIIHAITPLEQSHLYKLFPKNRIEIIPNAIDTESSKISVDNKDFSPEKILLFVGRVEPKKGVDLLISGFSKAKLPDDWRLVIIGPVWSQEYQRVLTKLVEKEGLENKVIFKGPLFGTDKEVWMRKSWVMAAPSHSEVMGLVNLEAAVHHLPSITTFETGLYDWNEGGGILISPNIDEIAKTLQIASSWSISERKERGCASYRLVDSRYSWKSIKPAWEELYSEII